MPATARRHVSSPRTRGSLIELRKIILRVLLWSLGIGAAVGVVAVLVGGDEIFARIIATAFATSGAALLLWPMANMIDHDDSRPAGIFGMMFVIVEFILVLTLVWVFETFLDHQFSERLFGSIWALLFTGLTAIVCLRLMAATGGRVAGIVGAALCAVVTVLFLGGVWIGGSFDDELFESGATLACYGALASLCLIGIGTNDRRHWRWVGVATAVLMAGALLKHIWFGGDSGPIGITLLTCTSFMAAYSNIILLIPLKQNQRWLRIGTMVAVAATLTLITVMVIAEDDWDIGDSIVARLIGATGIVGAFGTLALGVLARINRKVEVVVEDKQLTQITLRCPRCSKRQTLPIGKGACEQCRLVIEVRVSEPLCHGCGYNLSMSEADNCPECGTAIQSL